MATADEERLEFRLRPALRYVLGGAVYLWVLIFLALLWQREAIPARTYLSVFFFIGLFSAVLIFYNGLTIVADRYGVTYRGLLSFRNYPYESMLKADIRSGLTGLVSYDVFTKKGLLQFSSFIKGHKRLMELIDERADLARRGRISYS